MEVSSFGSTPEEARGAIQEALELYFEDAPASDTSASGGRHGRIEELVIY